MMVSWFSAGVSSAVATKLLANEIDKVIYTHIDDQHPDTMRFVRDCEEWFGKRIEIVQSPHKSVGNVLARHFYVGVGGAKCTRVLKKDVRKRWEYELPYNTDLVYVWGMDATESDRADRLETSMPHAKHRCPLIEKSISKTHAHEILRASGIKRPAMYELGYHNNNCIGCVKGGMGYWNKVRVDFPDIFESRARLERAAGHSFLNGVFLDELDPERGRHAEPICDDCGIMCELMSISND